MSTETPRQKFQREKLEIEAAKTAPAESKPDAPAAPAEKPPRKPRAKKS